MRPLRRSSRRDSLLSSGSSAGGDTSVSLASDAAFMMIPPALDPSSYEIPFFDMTMRSALTESIPGSSRPPGLLDLGSSTSPRLFRDSFSVSDPLGNSFNISNFNALNAMGANSAFAAMMAQQRLSLITSTPSALNSYYFENPEAFAQAQSQIMMPQPRYAQELIIPSPKEDNRGKTTTTTTSDSRTASRNSETNNIDESTLRNPYHCPVEGCSKKYRYESWV